jgi:transposase
MKTDEQIREELRQAEQNIALFAPVPIESVGIFTPVFTQSKKPKPSSIMKTWKQLCNNDQYNILQKEINALKEIGISVEDQEVGEWILRWSLVISRSSKPLTFICNNIHSNVINLESIQAFLMKNHYYMLKDFLRTESGVDSEHAPSEEILNWRTEKFRLLLDMQPDGIQCCFEEYRGKLSIGVQKSFECALIEHQMSMDHSFDISNSKINKLQT